MLDPPGGAPAVAQDQHALNKRRDPFQVQRELETAWRRIWQGAKRKGADWEAVTGCLTDLPPFAAQEVWTGHAVQATLRAMARGKAPGLDEWRVTEMRAWPHWLHDATADLLNEVETRGAWPKELPGPLGILLPKGGTDDPLDRRPIWLMPTLYRL